MLLHRTSVRAITATQKEGTILHALPYRTKLRLRGAMKGILIALAVLIFLLALALVYLGRYVVYDENGAHLDLHRSTAAPVDPSLIATDPSEALPQVQVLYADPSTAEGSTEATVGYYIDITMLQDPDAVMEALQELEGPAPVMIDLKSRSGAFYYSTGIEGAARPDYVDVAKVDAIISYLRSNGFPMIARVETFCDTTFALANLSCGLPIYNGALWADSDGCYWLDPEDELVRDYLKQIVSELASKGFREIVFDDFYFPDSTQIVYTSEKTKPELLSETAALLINYFSNSNVTISFGSPSRDFTLKTTDSRVYISEVDGSGVSAAVSGYSRLADAEHQLVFLTGSRDTRFDGYNLLRPLL